MWLIRAVFVGLVALASQPLEAAPVGDSEEKVLSVYNWADYIDPSVVARFEVETGIKVRYVGYDSIEAVESKIRGGNSGFDVVVVSQEVLAQNLVKFKTLDRSRLQHWNQLDQEILGQAALSDPGNAHGVPYVWGTVGIGYNVARVRSTAGLSGIDSWAAIFDATTAEKIGRCGLTLPEGPELLRAALIYLGKNPDTRNQEEISAARKAIDKIRPHVRYISSSRQYIDELVSGKICVAVGWNSDIREAILRGADESPAVPIAYSVPHEGATIWLDALAVPTDARHPGNAHTFINYVMAPATSAAIANYVELATPSKGALPMINAKLKADPAVYPPASVRGRLYATSLKPIPANAAASVSSPPKSAKNPTDASGQPCVTMVSQRVRHFASPPHQRLVFGLQNRCSKLMSVHTTDGGGNEETMVIQPSLTKEVVCLQNCSAFRFWYERY
jgi:putrescine transport system substrate-binding protein